jgi:diguanylate cyclase (GGDEF)-like protein
MSSTPAPQLAQLIERHGNLRHVAEGNYLFKSGETADSLYLVDQGQIKLIFDDWDRNKVLTSGALFGELSLLMEGALRSGSALVVGDAQLWELQREHLFDLMESHPQEVLAIVRHALETLLMSERKLIKELQDKNRQLEVAYDYLKRTQVELGNLEVIAYTDELTSLFNRRCFNEHLSKVFPPGSRRQTDYIGLLMIDLDNFKAVNDTLGHDVGDYVLRQMAGAIRDSAGKHDLPCRLGGDEFAVLVSADHRDQGQAMAQNLLSKMNTISHKVEQDAPKVGASIGGAILQPEEAVDSLVKRADQALYGAKRQGKNRVSWSN